MWPSRSGAATPASRPALGMRTASNTPSVSTHRCRLRPLICLPPSSPRSGPPLSVVFTDWLSMQRALGVGSRPACTRVCSRHTWTIFVHVPSSPLGKVVIDGAFGQHIMGQHIPLAATPVEREQCLEYLPHVHRTRAPSPVVLLGGWNHRCQYRPLLVRQIRRVLLSMQYSVNHSRALLC